MSRGLSIQGIVAVLVACVLTGCGGGGGGPPPSPPPPTFTVGGSISGLVGSVTLQNTSGAPLTVSANGSFTFAQTVAAGASYAVSVATQPELQACTVANGSGTASANVTNVAISCADTVQPPTLQLRLQPIKTFRFDWSAVPGIARYRLLEDATGNSGFTQVGADIEPSATSLDHIVPLHRRVNARYHVQACAATRCIDSNTVTASGSLAEAVGYFKASNITELDQFGFSIALSADGTTLAVGMIFEDSNGSDPGNEDTTNSGAVYVFVRNGAGPVWIQQAYIKALIPGVQDLFGHSVALDSSGATLAVGAILESGTIAQSGAVYVFGRTDGAWTEQAFLTASNPGFTDLFGSSLALSDHGQLAIGAPFEDGDGSDPDNNAARDSGAVYVFVREAAPGRITWRQDAYLKASNIDQGDQFGHSVALSRDGATLAVGAIFEDSLATGVGGGQLDGADDSGAVYVFAHAGQWAQQEYIKASNTDAGDRFGSSLALSADGSTLAVGATGEDSAATGINADDQSDNTALGAGAAYVFVRSGSEWEQQAYIKASDTTGSLGPGGDRFGLSLALSLDGSILAVGADGEDSNAIAIGGDERDNSADASGAVYVFERSNGAWAQRAYVKPSNTSPFYGFGFSVALSGDGTTLAAGATFEPGSDPGINRDQTSPPIEGAGAVYVY